MTTTTHYGFNLPAGTDSASITPINQNMGLLDTELYRVDTSAGKALDDFADEYDSSSTYAVGDFVIHDGQLYVCNTASTTGTWDSTKWDATTIGSEIESINATVGTVNSILADAIGEE